MSSSNPWYVESYLSDSMLLHPELMSIADLQATQLRELANLKPGSRVLDMAGGTGRLAMPLARLGIEVTVQDLSSPLLKEGQQRAIAENLNIRWVQGDMRTPAGSNYDAIISIFTSFGYFDSEEDNARVCSEVRKALAPGGCFVLDVTNRDMRISNQNLRKWKSVADLAVLEEHDFDLTRSRWKLTRTLVGPASTIASVHGSDGPIPGSKSIHYDIRIYSPHELVRLLVASGFSEIHQYASLGGEELKRDSWRIVTVAR